MNFIYDTYEKKKYLYMDLVSMLFCFFISWLCRTNNKNDTDVLSSSIETVLDREGIATKLYHIIVYMPE